MEKEAMHTYLAAFPQKEVLVLGDIMIDRYTFGEVNRISPEAPIPVLTKTSETFVPGGAANVAANIASLGAKAVLIGVAGNDHNKEILLALLRGKNIETGNILVHEKKPTTVKHRIVSGRSQQMLRVDEENTEPLGAGDEEKIYALAVAAMKHADIVIFSDYAKGFFSKPLAKKLIAEARRFGKKVVADCKPRNKDFFVGVDLIRPNLKEAMEMTGATDIPEIGSRLTSYFGSDAVLTRGGEGMSVFPKDGSAPYHVSGKKIKVADVSGAGDTAIATLALALASGADLHRAAVLANAAGMIVVQKPGTATLSREELASAFRPEHHVDGVGVVPKAWGYEKWLENNERYCAKLLSLNEGYQCSLHYHKIKDETFLVTRGHVRFEKDSEILHLREGGFVRIPPGTKHRFAGIEDSLIVEVSTHHDDADSYRIEESRKMDVA